VGQLKELVFVLTDRCSTSYLNHLHNINDIASGLPAIIIYSLFVGYSYGMYSLDFIDVTIV
jgi:hypothetical protein